MDGYRQSWSDSKNQIIGALLASSLHLHLGLNMVFVSIMLPPEMFIEPILVENTTMTAIETTRYFTANHTEEALTFSKEEASWMTSLLSIASGIGAALAGLITDRWGRKLTCLLTGLLYLLAWILTIGVTTNIDILYVARTLAGLAGGLCLTGLIYSAETTHKSIRTTMVASGSVFTCIGLLLTTLLGYFLSWKGVAIFSAVAAVVVCAGICFIPESPEWLSLHIKDEEKRRNKVSKSLTWLYKDPKIFEEEINRYKIKKQSMDIPEIVMDSERVNKAEDLKSKEDGTKLKKAIFILATVFFFQEFSGGYALNFYALQIFQATGTSDLDGWTCLMILGTIRLLMAIVSLFQYLGRRTLLLGSSSGMAVMMIATSIWVHITGPSLGPVIMILVGVAFSALGVIVVPWTITPELLPAKYRGSVSGYLYCFNYVIMFIVMKVFISLLDAVGIANIFLISGVFAVGMFVFSYLKVPETLGKSLDEVQDCL